MNARAKPSLLKSAVLAAGRRIWRTFYWPDGDCLWFGPARRAALDLLRERRHETIVGVSPTFTAILAARAAHRASPDARLVLDLGDPFSPEADIAPNNLAFYEGLNLRTERDCFRRASAVSVTTPQTAARYASAFPESASKIRVIPPLFSFPEARAGGRLFPQDGKARLVYVGTLYPRLREPRFLLQLFEALRARRPSCELHFFGDVHAFAALLEDTSRKLDGAVRVHGVVPRETVARAVDDADILVNIGNTTRDQLPSKVVEYAASGKPILNIARHAEDSSVSFLASYPDKLSLHDRGQAPAPAEVDALAEFAARLPRRLPGAAIDSWLAPYRLPRIAARYEEILR
jgi:glycosyltransferase involved in cell wall biosynthesis